MTSPLSGLREVGVKFSVYTVAATHAPAPMNGGLHVVPTYDFADVTS